ncbi:NADPH-dependent FMN reductase [Paraburkholderia terrae]|uniref:NADPH-dependent FMN reductase n=1 Tax=Paraburkholderia terrae TaxID=311230 RepID=UPI001EE2D898|nr:NAD(P)H-dependent oxidoreductase [Paraburkholderia terrae]GJH01336.1 NAD(P)H-dependent oxidoreductase [Paraburkholderia terrae]
MTIKVLALCGSGRRDSLNRKLLNIAARGAHEAGGEITFISSADYRLPLYEGDFEAGHGVPDSVRDLQRLFAEHTALLVASPEHNGGYTASLKNAIDWVSRPLAGGEPGIPLIAKKVAAVVSASPGPMGGVRSMLGMRGVLEKLGAIVIPQGFSLGAAHLAFTETGHLSDEKAATEVRLVGARLVEVTQQLLQR